MSARGKSRVLSALVTIMHLARLSTWRNPAAQTHTLAVLREVHARLLRELISVEWARALLGVFAREMLIWCRGRGGSLARPALVRMHTARGTDADGYILAAMRDPNLLCMRSGVTGEGFSGVTLEEACKRFGEADTVAWLLHVFDLPLFDPNPVERVREALETGAAA